ncbi:DUF2711 family protein [Shewanella sp. MMG014]|uniref:DUF2711 family protein n=1 Tax=Shewanella sp. MMG014 TaxID=2822691 RepID=UPI001B36479F|nr:DUF2711 family protein [Shewanella sp. MMG014]MBQ4889309.1 DUF2711 family protein [Shewanella sp. MMG014]
MIDRILPTPEKFASCPDDERILPFYDGQFECVYILLHPFFKPTAIDIERFFPSAWPDKLEIINGCDAISWREIIGLSGVNSLCDIDIGLRTSIGGLKKELSNEQFSKKLAELDQQNIIHPQEGDIPPLLENRLLKTIKELGHDWLWVGDQFGTERKLLWIDDLVEKDEIPSHGCIFTHDHSLLVTTHWDSHCSFLCSSKEVIEEMLSLDPFEGFYCTPKTEVYWGAYEI